MSEWIPCSERIPSEDGTYLCVFCDGDAPIVCVFETYMGTGVWDEPDGSSWYSYESGKITHWQPLPEPPQ